jgi:phthiocerol/phenolphthiocerol synthesis type-I polyketide synthase E
MSGSQHNDIAITGIACRFPGAKNKEEYWKNLTEEKESIKWFTDDELKGKEHDLENLLNNPNFVKARGVLEDIDMWDAGFFNILPKDAKFMDPQQRLWLETTWNAFEDAGIDPFKYNGKAGVFAGSFANTYVLNNILRNPVDYELYIRNRTPEIFQNFLFNDPSFLATRTAYFFNLKGTAISLQTACSTSLVAVCMACNSLVRNETDVCVAGGVTIIVPQEMGYIYQEGAIGSRDGHCRPYDKGSNGTIFGNGAGVVILKRLNDALQDNDHIYAVIKGWNTNNDGNEKIGYTAPSVEGQTGVISNAYAMADINAGDICYIEGHGTGTPLGDPIEVTALTKAFRKTTDKKQFCGLGSVKSNIGHLDAAAGVAGLIKIALATKNRAIPATLNFSAPNPRLNIAATPFYVQDKLQEIEPDRKILMGVSAFGIGGTNAHVLIGEAPEAKAVPDNDSFVLINISAKSKNALNNRLKDLSDYMKQNPDVSLGNIAYTYQTGRRTMNYKAFVVGKSVQELTNILDNETSPEILRGQSDARHSDVVFMFPGQGAQFINMGKQLYEKEKLFREIVDYCSDVLKPLIGNDLREVLYPLEGSMEHASELLNQTSFTQPALFVIEYALAKLWISWGITPSAMIGHSIGEFAAACISGVFKLDEALEIVAVRGKLMQQMPSGCMRAIKVNPEVLNPLLTEGISIAAHNAPEVTVVSGSHENMEDFDNHLVSQGLESIKLKTSHAFHSYMMDPALDPFIQSISRFSFNKPGIPFISGLTGNWITDAEASDVKYWAQQLRQPVQFSKGINAMVNGTGKIFLEVGPNTHLAGLAKQHPHIIENSLVISSLSHAKDETPSLKSMYNALGRLWLNGLTIDWTMINYGDSFQKVSIPGYPFEHKRYWIDQPIMPMKAEEKLTFKVEAEIHEEISGEKEESPVDVVAGAITRMINKLSGIDIDNIFPTVPFNEMGFDSLFMAQFAVTLEKQFKIPVKFRQLSVEQNTIKLLSEYIAENTRLVLTSDKSRNNAGRYKYLVPFQTKGSYPALVMIYGDPCHSILPGFLGSEQPYYGFHDLGADGDRITLNSVERISELYLEELLHARPNGPYILGGYSFGGVVAFHMANELRKRGHQVDAVYNIDCANPYNYEVYGLYNKLKYYILSPVYRGIIKYIRRVLSELWMLYKPLPVKYRQAYIFDKYMDAYSKYKPVKFDGSLILVKSTQSPCEDKYLGWRDYVAKDIDVFLMDGNHWEITNVPANNRILSENLKNKLKIIYKKGAFS